MAAPEITSIEVDRTSHVEIAFADGMVARWALADLRLACPCAECNSRRQQGRPVSVLAETKPDEVAITEASMAGAWGLNLDWSDGHSTGIYAFEKLREWADDGTVEVDITHS